MKTNMSMNENMKKYVLTDTTNKVDVYTILTDKCVPLVKAFDDCEFADNKSGDITEKKYAAQGGVVGLPFDELLSLVYSDKAGNTSVYKQIKVLLTAQENVSNVDIVKTFGTNIKKLRTNVTNAVMAVASALFEKRVKADGTEMSTVFTFDNSMTEQIARLAAGKGCKNVPSAKSMCGAEVFTRRFLHWMILTACGEKIRVDEKVDNAGKREKRERKPTKREKELQEQLDNANALIEQAKIDSEKFRAECAENGRIANETIGALKAEKSALEVDNANMRQIIEQLKAELAEKTARIAELEKMTSPAKLPEVLPEVTDGENAA